MAHVFSSAVPLTPAESQNLWDRQFAQTAALLDQIAHDALEDPALHALPIDAAW